MDKKDFDDFVARKSASEKDDKRAARAIEYLKAEAVEASKLTENEQWNRFLTHVQALVEPAQKLVAQTKDQLPFMMEDIEIRKAQFIHAFNMGRVQALKEVIELPKQIVEYYNSVKESEKVLEVNA